MNKKKKNTQEATIKLKHLFASAALGAGGYAAGMFGLGPVSFGAGGLAPAILATTGAALPPLWWLLSTLPPKPIKEYFPGISLLFNVQSDRLKPATMPIWQRLLCLSLVAGAGLNAALPDLNNHILGNESGPVVVAFDNGSFVADDWSARKAQIDELINSAESQNRQIVFVPAADFVTDGKIQHYEMMDASRARTALLEIAPRSWPVNHDALLPGLQVLKSEITGNASVFWLNNGLESNSPDFVNMLQDLGPLTVITESDSTGPHLLSKSSNSGSKLTIRVQRPEIGETYSLTLTASNEQGQPLLQEDAIFEADKTEAEVIFDIPAELRAQIARVSIDGEKTAGAVVLLDDNWRQRSVGLIETGVSEGLLDGSNFVAKAINPFTDLHAGSVSSILNLPLSVIVQTDETVLTQQERADIKTWVEAGGTYLRFAGPRLAAQPNDDLLPVEIRKGTRSTNGSLAGNGEGKIAAFSEQSPFHGLAIPESVQVNQIVLTNPSPDLNEYIWASLEDGTPLVTAKQEGEGWVVLVHTTANMDWANLPLSGEFFLQMMRAIVSHSQGTVSENQINRNLPALTSLDAEGHLERAPGQARPLTQAVLESGRMDATYRPGYYGDQSTRLARNVSDSVDSFNALGTLPEGINQTAYKDEGSDIDYGAWLLTFGFLALMADMAVRLRQNSGSSSTGNERQRAKPTTAKTNTPSGKTL